MDRETPERRRIYRTRPGYVVASVLLGAMALVYGALMGWQFAHDATVAGAERFIWIGLAMAIALVGAGAIYQCLHTRATLTTTTVELHDAFRTVTLRRDQVAGKHIGEAKYGISVTQLIPRDEGVRPMALWSTLSTDGELQDWLESLPDLDQPANRASAALPGPAAEDRRRRRAEAVIWALLLAFIGAGAYSLADGPWDPSRLKQLSGAFAGQREYGDCFAFRLTEHPQSFELCSTSYRKFDRESFRRDMRHGERLLVRVLDELKLNRTTGEIKYWVQDVRHNERVYLDLEQVQEHRRMERLAGIAILIACTVGAAFALWRAGSMTAPSTS